MSTEDKKLEKIKLRKNSFPQRLSARETSNYSYATTFDAPLSYMPRDPATQPSR